MGRIKTKLIKRSTIELHEKYGDEFTGDYKKNKEVVNRHVITQSKKIKNIIAGYATRLAKTKQD